MARPVTPGRQQHQRHVVGPVLILAAGVILLLNNLGVLPWSIWGGLWPFWPAVLILLGLEALVSGRVSWGGLLLALLLIGIGGLVIGGSNAIQRWDSATRPAGGLSSTIHQTLGGAQQADVQLEYGGGALDVGALPADDTTTLVDGQVFGQQAGAYDARYTVSGGTGDLEIGPREAGGSGFGRLQAQLTRAIPLDLSVSAGAADITLNLHDLQVTDLRLETGASRTRLTVPARGESNVRIEGGAATIAVQVPANVAARIVVEESPALVEVDQTRFVRDGNEYRTAAFDTATDRTTIAITVGAAHVTVQ
ncbi:MAG: hypothetical protein IT305_19515 [Chloroflexi bacterium]|nr:hypothetical protein [Chloroflexota bacterium]